MITVLDEEQNKTFVWRLCEGIHSKLTATWEDQLCFGTVDLLIASFIYFFCTIQQ